MGAPGRLLLIPTAPLVVTTVLASFLFGALLAYGLPIGLGVAVALGYGALVLTRFELGLVLWVFLIFFEALPAVERGVQAAGLLLAFAWVGTLAARRGEVTAFVRRHGKLVAVGTMFLLWITVSGAWADVPDYGVRYLQWPVAAVAFVIIATAAREETILRLLVGAFVAGVVVSMMLGFGGTPLGVGLPSLESGVDNERLAGGLGDPNFMASSIVAAVVLAGGLAAGAGSRLVRGGCLAAVALLILGLVATQSRGGLLAAAAAVAAGLVLFRGRRVVVGLVAVLVASAAVVMFSAAPTEYIERVNSGLEGETTGRVDLWRVAWEISKDHPVVGVGLNNFPVHSPRYVSELESIEGARYLAELRLVVHNSYLEMLSETGVVGLGLFLLFVLACLAAAWRAARRFEAGGEDRLAVLAQAVVVATIATLVASTFLSHGADLQLWVLLALGPALLAVAERSAPGALLPGASRARALAGAGAPAPAAAGRTPSTAPR